MSIGPFHSSILKGEEAGFHTRNSKLSLLVRVKSILEIMRNKSLKEKYDQSVKELGTQKITAEVSEQGSDN